MKGKIFAPICDDAGMAYDSKRDRTAPSLAGPKGSIISSYDLATGEAKSIEATGADKVQESFREAQGKGHFEFRESVYLPEIDMVMNGATGMFFDCAKNAWFAATIPSDSPDLAKHPSYNLGVAVDSRRNPFKWSTRIATCMCLAVDLGAEASRAVGSPGISDVSHRVPWDPGETSPSPTS